MKKIRVACYLRVSTDEQAKRGYSIPTQRNHLEEFIEKNDNLVLYDWYADEGISADKLKKRVELQRLLEDVKMGKVDLIIFTKLDRWFRSVSKYYKIQDILETYNVSWQATQEDYETVTANGKFKVNIMLSVAQQERDRDSERIKDVFENKVKNGEAIVPATSTPFGFTTKSIDGIKKIVHDPIQEPILYDLINYYFTFRNKRKSRTYLMEKYDYYLDDISMSKLFKNTLLYGSYRGVENYCEPYMTKEKFEELQEITKNNIRDNQTNHIYLFSGLIKCPICGSADNRHMNGATSINRYKDNVYQIHYYRCENHYTKKTCKFSLTINEKKLEKQLLENIKQFFAKRLLDYETNEKREKTPAVDVKKIEAEIERLNNMYQKGRIKEEKYDIEYDKLINKLKSADAHKKHKKDISSVKKILDSDFYTLYETLSKEEKQAFWHGIIKEIYVDADKNLIDIDFV